MTDERVNNFYIKQDYAAERQLLLNVRMALSDAQTLKVPGNLQVPFNPAFSQVYITLFQRGLKPVRWGARKANLQETLQHVVNKIKAIADFQRFDVADHEQCRILFEIVTEETECNIRNLTGLDFTENRFEPGVTGFKYSYKGVVRYFMPTDSVVHSIMSVPQLLNFLAKKTGVAKRTNSITERGQLMRSEPIDYKLIKSLAFVSFKDRVLPLFRGYPVPVKINKEIILDSILKSIDWLVENMYEDGSFLYYYDSYLDTRVDFDHPNMTDPLYNNILRHSGGTITLIRAYELTQDQRYLEAANKSLGFLLSTIREHEYKNNYACYPFDNKKSKLGGAGIGLVALMHYYRHTQDESYRKYIDGIVRHILSRVDEAGEMIGYYIHPLFNNGQPIIDPPDEIKKQLFSFYYPGEALLGLALYYLHINNIDQDLKTEIYAKSLMALDFLVDIRPIKYQELFTPLPADAWLMQAIEEWVKVDGFQKQSYIDFVFNDAQAMFDHMYTEETAPEFDYIGGFYYNYGDHVYHDASRCEGVVAAYYLAKYLGNEQKAEYIMQNMLKSAKGLMYTRHTPESTYAHLYPEKSINSFRFKLTRQWVRVDSVQHAACFFTRFFWALNDQSDIDALTAYTEDNNFKSDPELDFEMIKIISTSGFSSVYQACSKIDPNKLYAIKIFKDIRFLNFIDTEIEILKDINQYPYAVHFYETGKINNDIYLKFDYVDSPDLRKIINRQGVFDELKTLIVLKDILEFLKFTAALGILHLDIKPENILFYKQRYTLIDWGLSKKLLHVNTLYRKGDPIYLAPEMFAGYRNFASEIYSLGCVLYYLLAGKHIYNLSYSDCLAAKIVAHYYIEPGLPDTVSEKMQYLLARMLDKNPETRADIAEIEYILQSSEILELPESSLSVQSAVINKSDQVALYERLATDGVAYAQAQLGMLLEQGKHTAKDDRQALYWYEQAAAQNFAEGQCQLGLAYKKGVGVTVDLEKAQQFLRLAADRGHADAQYYLGEFYELGLNCAVDMSTALDWYEKSARNANKKAYQALNRLKQSV